MSELQWPGQESGDQRHFLGIINITLWCDNPSRGCRDNFLWIKVANRLILSSQEPPSHDILWPFGESWWQNWRENCFFVISSRKNRGPELVFSSSSAYESPSPYTWFAPQINLASSPVRGLTSARGGALFERPSVMMDPSAVALRHGRGGLRALE